MLLTRKLAVEAYVGKRRAYRVASVRISLVRLGSAWFPPEPTTEVEIVPRHLYAGIRSGPTGKLGQTLDQTALKP